MERLRIEEIREKAGEGLRPVLDDTTRAACRYGYAASEEEAAAILARKFPKDARAFQLNRLEPRGRHGVEFFDCYTPAATRLQLGLTRQRGPRGPLFHIKTRSPVSRAKAFLRPHRPMAHPQGW